MAECQPSTDDLRKPFLTQEGQQGDERDALVPLSLPQGVTPEIAARLTTSILMRQVYCSSCPWTQWLLLASIGILHGQAAPTLDSVSLHQLQGTLNAELTSSGELLGDAEEDPNLHLSVEELKEKTDSIENAVDHVMPFTLDSNDADVGLGSTFNVDKSLVEPSPTSHKSIATGNNIPSEIPMRSSTPKVSHPENSFRINQQPPEECHVSKEKHNKQTCSDPSKQCKVSNQESVSVQVTPRKLGILASKWVQVKGPRRTDAQVQTESSPSHEILQIGNSVAQPPVAGCATYPSKTFGDRETQTILKINRDKSSQTDIDDLRAKDEPSQPLWRMIPMSGISTRRKHRVHGKKRKVRNNASNDQEVSSNRLDKDLKGSSAENSTLKEEQLFHGRPLLMVQGDKPVEIPLDSAVSLHYLLSQDPRLSSKSNR